MNFKIILMVCLTLFLLTGGCEIPPEDVNPPSSPEMVGKSLPYDLQEKGIDAEYYAGQHQIKIEWNRVSDIDLKGYNIYRSEGITWDSLHLKEPSQFQVVGSINLPDDPDNIFYDPEPGLEWNLLKTYFYFVRSIDNAENLSEPSDTVSYMLLRPPQPISPPELDSLGNNLPSDPIPTFVWRCTYTGYDFPHYFSIRLQDCSNLSHIFTVWCCFLYNRWIGIEETDDIELDYFTSSENIPESVLHYLADTLYSELPAGSYRWKIKGIYEVDDYSWMDLSSGESDWKYFEVE